jgi:Flp pilus assembly protein TadG
MKLAHPKMSQKRRLVACVRGVVAVEFALILPLLLILLLGMVEVSLMLYDQAIITNASREGARAGIVLRTPKVSASEIEAVVLGYSENSLVSLGAASRPIVTVDQAPDPVFSTSLSVSVAYAYSGFGMVGLLTTLTGPIQLKATSVMKNE